MVNTYKVVGDQDGKDVGRTGVTVLLNTPAIIERQTGNCLSPKALSAAVSANLFSPAVTAGIRTKLAASAAVIQSALAQRHAH